MRLSLLTSPHLDHSAFHRYRAGAADGETRFAQSFVPMGLLSLAGKVEPHAMPVIADVNKAINARRLPMSHTFYDEVARWVLEADPDLVGMMTEADSYHHVVRIAQAIKSRRPSVLTVLGGPHASAVHRETIGAFPALDFVIRGEGEEAFDELVRALGDGRDLAQVGNLSWRDASGDVVVNPELPLIPDLDSLPWPDLSRVDLAPEDVIYLEVGRGCPFRCNFCFTAPYWKRKHRIKSAERVIGEILYFRDTYGRTDFNFTHDLLTTDRRWVLDFCEKASQQDLGVTWTCSSRTDTIDCEQIAWMRKAGCRDIYFGVETGTGEMQRAIDKNLDLDQARKIIRAAVDEGIGATVGFIAGLPGETATTLRGTIGEAFSYLGLDRTTVHLFGFSPYKGSSQFPKIERDLVLDDRFIDFPLGEKVRAENSSLMEAHFDVFARYGRLREYEGLPEAIVRTAEEFFPIVNALRSLLLGLVRRGVDPFEMLLAWSGWIEARNTADGKTGSGMYAGTIEQFIEFLASFLAQAGRWNDVVAEMLRWEQTKNVLRGRTGAAQVPVEERASAQTRLGRNPSLLVERFRHTSAFLPEASTSASGIFAFFGRSDGGSEIVALGDLAATILDVVHDPLTRDEIVAAIEAFAGSASGTVARDVDTVIQRLRESQLLVPAASRNAAVASEPAAS